MQARKNKTAKPFESSVQAVTAPELDVGEETPIKNNQEIDESENCSKSPNGELFWTSIQKVGITPRIISIGCTTKLWQRA